MIPNSNYRKNRLERSRGVALITTLLLLSLFTVMTLAMVIATTSDTLIDGYYRNFRGSFYAADSGINSARQYLMNQFAGATITPANFGGLGATYSSNLSNTSSGFGAYQSIVGSQASSWPGTFKVDSSNTYVADASHPPTCFPHYTGSPSGITSCTVAAGTSGITINYYTYSYPYKITVIGQSRTNEQNTVAEQGSINVTVNYSNSSTTTSSFAAWGTLFDQYSICSSPFVKGTMSGKFFSNQSWNFGDNGLVGNGSYIFTDPVGAHDANVGYMYSDNNSTCHQSSATSDSNSVTTTTGSGRHQTTTTTTTTISPTFQGGLSVNQPAIPLPTDTFSQERAVLDGYGDCSPAGVSQSCSTPSQTEMSVLRSVTSGQWPATGTQPSSGVFAPYTTTATASCSSPPCFTGGGIFIQGNADSVTLTASTSGSGTSAHKLQVFAVKQGSTTTTVTVDLTANTTSISDNLGHSSGTINGVPENYNTSSEAAMVYVNGNISGTSGSTTTGLSGPSSGAAVQDGSSVTVTSTGTIAITGNITYSHEPVTLTQSGSTPADTLISGVTNVLGIYSSGGDIQLRPTSNVSTLEIDASLAMIQSGGSGGLVAQWNSIGTLTIVGGRIANQAKSGASLGTRNIWFDQRFAQGSYAPPWFPSTTVTTSGTNSALPPVVTSSRTSWVNTTAE